MRITYEERHPGDWGGFKPKVVVEYDERNHFLMAIEITYNKREANKNFAYNHTELKEKIQQELDTAQVTATDGSNRAPLAGIRVCARYFPKSCGKTSGKKRERSDGFV